MPVGIVKKATQKPGSRQAAAFVPAYLVGHAVSSVTLRDAVRVRIKTRFAGKGGSLVKKRNAESRRTASPEGPRDGPRCWLSAGNRGCGRASGSRASRAGRGRARPRGPYPAHSPAPSSAPPRRSRAAQSARCRHSRARGSRPGYERVGEGTAALELFFVPAQVDQVLAARQPRGPARAEARDQVRRAAHNRLVVAIHIVDRELAQAPARPGEARRHRERRRHKSVREAGGLCHRVRPGISHGYGSCCRLRPVYTHTGATGPAQASRAFFSSSRLPSRWP